MNEAAFALPEGEYADKTAHTLEHKLPSGGTLEIVVLRRPMEVGKTLRESVDSYIASSEKRMSGYSVLESADAVVAGASAIQIRSRFRHQGDIVYQIQAHVVLDGTWMLLVVTAKLTEQAACDAAFDGILQTFTWRTA